MAKVKQRLGRAKVLSHPACIFIADETCTVMLYVPSKNLDGGGGAIDNPQVIIGVDQEIAIPYGDENNPILPFDRGFPVYLEEGQQLFAVSVGESEVSFSIIPAPLDAIGY